MAPRRSRITFVTPFDSQENETREQDSHHQSASSSSAPRRSQRVSSQASTSGRGPTQKADVWGMRAGQRLYILFNDRGQPVGPNSASWTSFLSTLAQRDNIIPIAVDIDKSAEQRAWEQINRLFYLAGVDENG